MRFIDLFGGIGGFSLGLEKCGHKCVGYYEIDKYAVQIYNKNFGTEYEPTDITTVNAGAVPDHDILCAGFPCQPFSIAGKRQGFKDIRGTLFAEIVRIAEKKKPGILFLENVKGLLNHNNGETFATILNALYELGYCLEWEVLNSKNFGVPQNRERVFIIGHFGKGSGQQIFPLGEINGIFAAEKYREQRKEGFWGENISSTIDARYGSIRNAGETYILSHHPRTNNPKIGGSGPLLSNEHCFCIDRIPHKLIELTKNVSDAQRIYAVEGIAKTLKGETGGQNAKTGLYSINDYRIRRLTPIECERLQGFPDGWTEGISNTQRYKCLGNAVTVNVIEEIGKRLEL